MRETLSPFSRIWPVHVSVASFYGTVFNFHTKVFPRLRLIRFGDLSDLDRIIKNEIHELIETLEPSR
jgi:hypothetical protein